MSAYFNEMDSQRIENETKKKLEAEKKRGNFAFVFKEALVEFKQIVVVSVAN